MTGDVSTGVWANLLWHEMKFKALVLKSGFWCPDMDRCWLMRDQRYFCIIAERIKRCWPGRFTMIVWSETNTPI